jgi:esterase/lipase
MKKLETKEFELKYSNDRIIDGYTIFENNRKMKPLVLFQHGFKGFKDWGFFPYACNRFAENGAIAVCYNFSMNGMRGSNDLVVRPEDFAQMTISNLLEDMDTVKESFIDGEILEIKTLDQNWDGRIFLVGHSLGGGLSIIHAKEADDIEKLATWASIANFDRYTERQKKIWQEQGYAEITNSRTKQVLRLNVSYYEDIDKNREKYDIRKAVSELETPLLICHGTEDMTVRISDADMLLKAGDPDFVSQLKIEKTAHTFGAVHPFDGSNEALDKLINKTISFFEI